MTYLNFKILNDWDNLFNSTLIPKKYERFYVNKAGLSFYKRKSEEWKQIQTNEFIKIKILADLFEDDSNQNKRNNFLIKNKKFRNWINFQLLLIIK